MASGGLTASAAHRPDLSRPLASIWRARPAVRWGALAVALGATGSRPWSRSSGRSRHRCQIVPSEPPDGWRFAAPGIVIAEPRHDWLEAASAAETLRLSLVIRPLSAAPLGLLLGLMVRSSGSGALFGACSPSSASARPSRSLSCSWPAGSPRSTIRSTTPSAAAWRLRLRSMAVDVVVLAPDLYDCGDAAGNGTTEISPKLAST
jgi:hypothetical protein